MSDNSILVTASQLAGRSPPWMAGSHSPCRQTATWSYIIQVGQPPGGRQAPSAAQSRKRSCRPMGTLYLTGLRDRFGQRAPRGIRDRTWSFKMTETL